MGKAYFTNWQTSTSGLALILLGVGQAAFGFKLPGFAMEPGAAIVMGIGLLQAKDGAVIGGTVPATTEALKRVPAAMLYGFAIMGMLLYYGTGPAYTADMPPPPAKAAFAAAPVAASYSGLYFGINGAGAKTDGKFDFLKVPGTGELKPSGLMAGATVGFGAWLNGLYVAAEADGDYDWTKQNVGCAGITACTMKSSWWLSQRAIVGITLGSATGAQTVRSSRHASWPAMLAVPDSLAGAALMPFVTGGMAERRFEACVAGSCGREWITGPTMGGGMRIPLSANFSMDLTYLHTIYNKHFTPADGPSIFGANFKATSEDSLMMHLVAHF